MKKSKKIFNLVCTFLLGSTTVSTITSCTVTPGYKDDQNTFDADVEKYKTYINQLNVYGAFSLDKEFNPVSTLTTKIVGKDKDNNITSKIYIGKATQPFMTHEIMVGVDARTNLITGVVSLTDKLHTNNGDEEVKKYIDSLVGTDGGNEVQSGQGSGATLSKNAIQKIAKEAVLAAKDELVSNPEEHTYELRCATKTLQFTISYLYPERIGFIKADCYIDGELVTNNSESLIKMESSDNSVIRVVEGLKYYYVGPGKAKLTLSLVDHPEITHEIEVTVRKESIGTNYTDVNWETINQWTKEENPHHNDKLYKFTGRIDFNDADGKLAVLYNNEATTLGSTDIKPYTENALDLTHLGGMMQEDMLEKETSTTFKPNENTTSNFTSAIASSYKDKLENPDKIYCGDIVSLVGIMYNGEFYGFVEKIVKNTTETDINVEFTGDANTLDSFSVQVNRFATTGEDLTDVSDISNLKLKYKDYIVITAKQNITVQVGSNAAVTLNPSSLDEDKKTLKVFTWGENPFDKLTITVNATK